MTRQHRTRQALDMLHIGRKLAASAADPYRPIMAHLVVTRRCNLSCGYCFEYDKSSPPVPFEELARRIDHLAGLGTIFVTLTGGESLLHPEIAELVAYVRERGMVPVMNSNGYLLSRGKIEALNRAGLFGLQVSVDNVEPNDVTVKSLRPLLPKLRLLAEHAQFRVRINTVLGSGAPRQALEVARAALSLGFDAKCSLVRDERGAVKPLDAESREVYDRIRQLGKRSSRYLSEDFQLALADRGEVEWKCRSGARYFTVCEDGLVHLCESSWGNPGIPLVDYTRAYIAKAFHAPKSCASRCAVAYAHQVSRIDAWRPQRGEAFQVTKQCWMQTSQQQVVPLARLARGGA